MGRQPACPFCPLCPYHFSLSVEGHVSVIMLSSHGPDLDKKAIGPPLAQDFRMESCGLGHFPSPAPAYVAANANTTIGHKDGEETEAQRKEGHRLSLYNESKARLGSEPRGPWGSVPGQSRWGPDGESRSTGHAGLVAAGHHLRGACAHPAPSLQCSLRSPSP
jgi:hypothetical protein